MGRAMKRVGRGLNSFVYRKSSNDVNTKKSINRETRATDFLVSSDGIGEFNIVERRTGKILATQIESRDEGERWIAEHVASRHEGTALHKN